MRDDRLDAFVDRPRHEHQSMPTVLRAGPYRVYFFSHETGEPPHVHVDRDECSAKYWIRPVRLEYNLGFRSHELTRIERILENQAGRLLEAWHEFFGAAG